MMRGELSSCLRLRASGVLDFSMEASGLKLELKGSTFRIPIEAEHLQPRVSGVGFMMFRSQVLKCETSLQISLQPKPAGLFAFRRELRNGNSDLGYVGP